MPKLVRNSSAVSRSGARSLPYARSVTLISGIVISSCLRTLDMLDHRRSEGKRRPVEEEEPRAGHEGPPDRNHLLLPAGERTGELSPALAQDRKGRVHALEALAAQPARRRGVAADLEILLNGHGGKEAATF